MKIFSLFAICYVLLSIETLEKQKQFAHFYQHSTSSPVLNILSERTKPYFKDTKNWGLAKGLTLGDTKSLAKSERKIFKEINLSHLFSPSGLHLSSILYPLRSLFRFLPWTQCLILLSMISVFLIPGLFSLKRNLIYHQFKFINKYSFNFNSSHIFIGVFVIDFMFGSYGRSSLSFIYSLLFWGIFVFEKKFIKKIVYLSLAQYMCICFTSGTFYFFSIFVNMFISLIFTFIFPFIALNFIMPSRSIFFNFNEYCLFLLREFIQYSYLIIHQTPSIPSSHSLLISIMAFIFFKERRLMIVLIASVLISPLTDCKDDLRLSKEVKLLKARYWNPR